jgi:hypothetical protein
MTQRKRTCATCRYWTENAEIVDTRGRVVKTAGMCGGIGSTWDWRLEDEWPADGERALLVDSNALLLTRPDFFCAEWHATPERVA